ncbi:helix-turn-helix domain-containing protein [Aneurinibacillus uraniidurans]|uniref:helix-turn-helix domain-containing protein n=1 Tax=Aneurinibacillus uraniidurans TaxID=2966586 RepID=UPI00234B404E|nr:helix-turn-helix domain-containing protein [Aneurinibacillus sp. B1]WCN37304.1 helix-turn-helix domain-containing protein [Aneurinibacillus sp. B1]
MINKFGQRVRTLRLQQGIGLNALANRLNVSPAYLSNLENGKTETVNLSFLHQLQEELNLDISILLGSADVENHRDYDEFGFRLQHASLALNKLQKLNPSFAEYLLASIERGVSLFSGQQEHPSQSETSQDYH